MKCVIPCAGKGTRIGTDIPKVLNKVNGKSLVRYVMCTWKGMVDGYVIIVSPENQHRIREEVGPDIRYVVQEEPRGLADAILQVENVVEDKFVVHLGDCLFKGEFEVKRVELGVGAWETNNVEEVRENYRVEVQGERVKKVIEKPDIWGRGFTYNCGMGVYFFDRRVFDYIREFKEKEEEGDLTEVIQHMVDSGEEITPVWFRGEYVNINTQEDIRKAEELLR